MDANAALPIPLNLETLDIDQRPTPTPAMVHAATASLTHAAARAKAAGQRRREERPAACPPTVTRGAKSQTSPPACPDKGVYTSIDWVRMVGPEELVPSLLAWMGEKFGTYRQVGSRMRFAGGFEFEAGAALLTGHASGICLVELPGGALSGIDGDGRIELLRELAFTFGMTARRLDVARDYVGQGLDIFVNAYESCHKNKELCGAKENGYSVWINGGDEHEASSRTLYLGKRGKLGSGRMVRIYDKGKEQKIPGIQAGYWERFEAEFSKDIAHAAALMILNEREEFEAWAAPKRKAAVPGPWVPSSRKSGRKTVPLEWREDLGEDWVQRAAALTFGAFDFREVKYHTSKTGEVVKVRELDRRPRVKWYAALVEGVKTFKVRLARRFPTLTRWARWMGTAGLPTVLAMAKGATDISGHRVSVDDMFRKVIGREVEAAQPGKRSVLWEFLHALDNPDYWNLPDDFTPPRLLSA